MRLYMANQGASRNELFGGHHRAPASGNGAVELFVLKTWQIDRDPVGGASLANPAIWRQAGQSV